MFGYFILFLLSCQCSINLLSCLFRDFCFSKSLTSASLTRSKAFLRSTKHMYAGWLKSVDFSTVCRVMNIHLLSNDFSEALLHFYRFYVFHKFT